MHKFGNKVVNRKEIQGGRDVKRLVCVFIIVTILSGCQGDVQIDKALSLRQNLLSGNGCRFVSEITADYGEVIYQFTMACQADKQGNLGFTVTEPESISGIAGTVTETGGHLTFDGTALAFATIADGQVTPVTAPWLFLKTLRSGYIVSCADGEETTYLQIDDSYADNALHLDIWLDQQGIPVRAEILWEGRRILSLVVRDFTIL